MAGISKEDLEAEKNKTKQALRSVSELQSELSEMTKKANSFEKLEAANAEMAVNINELQKANKELIKSGASIRSDSTVFDAKIGLDGGIKHVATVTHDKNNRDELYRYSSTKGGKTVDYLLKYRDGRFSDSQIS